LCIKAGEEEWEVSFSKGDKGKMCLNPPPKKNLFLARKEGEKTKD